MRAITVLAVLLLHATSVCAADCEQPQTQVEMTLCAKEAYESANADLVKLFTSMVEESDLTRAELWKRSQDAWRTYRDATCAVYADLARGGTMAGSLHGNCMSELTRSRINELQKVRTYFEP